MPIGLSWKRKLVKGDFFFFTPKVLRDTMFSVGGSPCPFSRFLSVKRHLW